VDCGFVDSSYRGYYIFPTSDYERIAEERVNYSHERNVADFHVRMTVGAKKTNIPYIPRKTFIQWQVSREYQDKYPFKTNTKHHNWELCRFNLGNKQYLQPDDLSALVQDRVNLFFLEIDQNTVPNVSKDKRRTIQAMFEKYIRIYREGIFERTYKVDNMRVLFITKSDAHVEHLRKLVKDAHEMVSVPSTSHE
jgi:Replication-relaxation